MVYTTNAIESMNYQIRKVTKTRGQVPNDEAAYKLFYLAISHIEDRTTSRGGTPKNPSITQRGSGTQGWKNAMNHFATIYTRSLTRLHRRVRRRHLASLVDPGRSGRRPRRQAPDDQRRLRRRQRLPNPVMENRTRHRLRPGHHRLPLPTRHQQVEQDGTPVVRSDHQQLAGTTLSSYQVMIELIGATITRTGLTVHAEVDAGRYPRGQTCSLPAPD